MQRKEGGVHRPDHLEIVSTIFRVFDLKFVEIGNDRRRQDRGDTHPAVSIVSKEPKSRPDKI